MDGGSVRHTIWGPIELNTSSSHSPEGSSEQRDTVKSPLPDLSHVLFQEPSSSSTSGSAGKQDLQAAARSLEQRSDPAPGDSGAASSTEPLSREAALLDSLSMWSKGSMLHQRGQCKPCHYAHTSIGCIRGRDCAFCHLPHTGNSQHRPCKTRRRQCHLLAKLLDEQHPDELRRLVASEAAGEVAPEGGPESQGLALCVQQVASKSPYMRKFMRRHWSAVAPGESMQPDSGEATSSTQAHSSQRAEGRNHIVQL